MAMPIDVATWLRGASLILPGMASSSRQATRSSSSAIGPLFSSPILAASGWRSPLAQCSSVLPGMPSWRAVAATLPALAARAARALALSSSE